MTEQQTSMSAGGRLQQPVALSPTGMGEKPGVRQWVFFGTAKAFVLLRAFVARIISPERKYVPYLFEYNTHP